MDEVDLALRRYAGPGYASPKVLVIERFDIFDHDGASFVDFLAELQAFGERNKDHEIVSEIEYGWCDDRSQAAFIASRPETPEETAARIDGLRKMMTKQMKEAEDQRRRQYEAMKREFGDA